jgi:ABC-type antimicrobial peptide transport system permease subunit
MLKLMLSQLLHHPMRTCLSALMIGGALSLIFYGVTKGVVVSIYPGLRFLLPWGPMLRMIAVALASAVLGAAYPAYRASHSEPIAALSYE